MTPQVPARDPQAGPKGCRDTTLEVSIDEPQMTPRPLSMGGVSQHLDMSD